MMKMKSFDGRKMADGRKNDKYLQQKKGKHDEIKEKDDKF
jgi:hypothetical protein